MGEMSENVQKVEVEQSSAQVEERPVKIEQNEATGVTIALKKMNPSSAWSNPPPPGIDMDEESKHSAVSSSKSVTRSIIDVIDPFIKNPEYIKYKKSLSRERGHYKRSRSRSRDRKKRYRSRSRSRGRRRRSRSRSRGRRHRRYSHSSSRSRSSSYERRHRHKKRRTRKHSRSTSRSRKHRPDRRSRRSRTRSHTPLNETYVDNEQLEEKIEEDEPELSKENAFKNDGSFLEMFKKLQEEKARQEAEKAEAASSEPKKPLLPPFGKRRGGRVLKTGMVEKTKATEEDETTVGQDAWSIYLKEVKKYKEACCDDDSKTRPLVK